MAVQGFGLKSFTDETEEGLKRLLQECSQSNRESGFDLDFPSFLLREKEREEMFAKLRKEGFRRALTRDTDVIGVIFAEKSAWDTNHFGFGVGKIRSLMVSDALKGQSAIDARDGLIKECLTWMKQNSVKCIMTRVDLDRVYDIAAYEQNGFQLADVLVTLHLNVDSMNPALDSLSSDSFTIRPSRNDDVVALMENACKAFINDHFHRDPRFTRDKSDELFAKWVYNSCNGSADMVLVATEENDEPCGFIVCKLVKLRRGLKYGVIDLIAVSPLHQGKGIGTQLVRESVNWFAQNVDSVYVGTQANNNASIRTYEKVGFKPVRTELTLHKWFHRKYPSFNRQG